MRRSTCLLALFLPLVAGADLMVPEPDPTPAPRTRPRAESRPETNTEAVGPKKCKDCGEARDLKKKVDDVRRTTTRTSGCNLDAVAAHVRRLGAATVSGGNCLPTVRRAFQLAGCSVPAGFAHNAWYAFNHLKGVWRCRSGGTAASVPNNAVIFSVGTCGSHHTEFKSGNCYYSDFHQRDCLASSEYAGCPYRQIGWCQP